MGEPSSDIWATPPSNNYRGVPTGMYRLNRITVIGDIPAQLVGRSGSCIIRGLGAKGAEERAKIEKNTS